MLCVFYRNSVLHYMLAAQNCHINVIKVLMDAKAEIDCICKVHYYKIYSKARC